MTFNELSIEVTNTRGTKIRVTHLRDLVVTNGFDRWTERIRVRLENTAGAVTWCDIDSPSADLLALFAGCARADFFPPLMDRLAEEARGEHAADVMDKVCVAIVA